ncbi:MAG TPA: hypothetical protein ENN38_07375 [Actinobacteria bacterium]|nr:hypothetical protein [Actinomycetota bacterium]
MDKLEGKKKHKRYGFEPNEILWRMLREEDVKFLRRSFECSEVVSFCYWIEERLLSHLFSGFSCKNFIEEVKSKEIYLSDVPLDTGTFIFPENLIGEAIRTLGAEKESLLSTFIDFLYDENVLDFYRKIAEIVSPVLELDIISVSKALDKELLSDELEKKLEALVRQEFAYWAEKFVTSWYKNLSQTKDISVYEVPIGPIIEYDLMRDVVLQVPKKTYWYQGEKK